MLDIEKISHTIHHTDQWRKERLGRITASLFGCLIGEKSHLGIFTQGAMSYIIDLAGEKVSGKPSKQEFFTDATNWGNANEPDAIKVSCAKMGFNSILRNSADNSTHRFIRPDDYTGCTPDALILPSDDVKKCFDVNEEKIKVAPLETKCPPTFNIFGRFLNASTPAEIKALNKIYYWQVLFQMYCCNSLIGYFGVYHPDFPNNCNVIEFRKIKLIEDFKILEATLSFAKKEIDKWVNIFSNAKKDN